MQSIFFRSFSNQLHPYTFSISDISNDPIQAFKEEIFDAWGIPIQEQTLFHNGRLIHSNSILENLGLGSVIDIGLSIKGGKGGFGSLLRGQAKSNKKITNFDASRDLQGRRIRNVKLQQRVMEWAKQRREEEKNIKKELDEYNKVQKEIQGVQRDIRLTQEFKDKVDKWDNEMSSSIRAGAKKAKKSDNKKETREELLDDFVEPQKKKKVVTEEIVNEVIQEKNTAEPLDSLNSKLSKKLAAILKNGANDNNNTDSKPNGETEEKKLIETQTNQTEGSKNGFTEEKKEVKEFEQIDLKSINSIDDLVNLGGDHLKHELMRLGLKCGGSVQDRAKRLYDIKLKPELLFDPKYIAKK